MKRIIKSVLCFMLTLITIFSVLSMVASAKTVVDLSKPENVRTELYPKGIAIIWEPTVESQNYRHIIYRSDTGKAGTWKKLVIVRDHKFYYIDETAVMGKTYYYTVKKYYEEPETSVVHVSEMSGKHKITAKPARWELSSTTNCGKGVLIKWAASASDFDGYVIYKSTENKAGTWTKIATIKNGDIGTYTDNKVSVGETYYYCIKTYRTVNGKNVYGQASPSKKSTIKDVAKPKNLTVEYEGEKVKITFDKVPATRGYMIYRSESGKAGTWTKIIVTTTNSKTEFYDETAKFGTKYYYTVKSYKNLNGKNLYSGNAKVATIGPQIICRTKETVTLEDRYDEHELVFRISGIDFSDLRIYVDGDEYTPKINSYHSAEFFKDKAICDLGWGQGENELVFFVMRNRTGESTVRVEYAYDNSIYDECKFICIESEAEKDFVKVDELFASGLGKVRQARNLLADGYDYSMKDNDVTQHKNFTEVKELVLSANSDFNSAALILEEYNEDYINFGLDYRKIKINIDECVEITAKTLNSFDDDSGYSRSLSYVLAELGSITKKDF